MKSKQSEKLIKQQFKLMSNGSLCEKRTANEMTEIDADPYRPQPEQNRTIPNSTLDSVPYPNPTLRPSLPDRNCKHGKHCVGAQQKKNNEKYHI